MNALIENKTKKPHKVNYMKIYSRTECYFTKNDAIVVSLLTYKDSPDVTK